MNETVWACARDDNVNEKSNVAARRSDRHVDFLDISFTRTRAPLSNALPPGPSRQSRCVMPVDQNVDDACGGVAIPFLWHASVGSPSHWTLTHLVCVSIS